MGNNIHIDVHHITRVEGHGNIAVEVNDGVVERCEWQVPEAPRFFEAMVRGRHYSEVARITSRICGICSIGHTLASVKATEAALGIEVTPQTKQAAHAAQARRELRLATCCTSTCSSRRTFSALRRRSRSCRRTPRSWRARCASSGSRTSGAR